MEPIPQGARPAEQELQAMAVNTGECDAPAKHAQEFRDNHKLTYPILVDADQKAAKKFEVNAFPTNMLIDSEEVVRYVGERFDPDELNKTLTNLIK